MERLINEFIIPPAIAKTNKTNINHNIPGMISFGSIVPCALSVLNTGISIGSIATINSKKRDSPNINRIINRLKPKPRYFLEYAQNATTFVTSDSTKTNSIRLEI
ncbi:MAG: hypothetical protein C00003105_01113 [ANME-2 cluster archaeon HR1]|nr:MAG: hypothetical protein C00003105_01113 [ANME-2 cluster archaeon HR1]